jgi:hypothetical protein
MVGAMGWGRRRRPASAALLTAAIALLLPGCAGRPKVHPIAGRAAALAAVPSPDRSDKPPSSAQPTDAAAIDLVPWTGPVEHLFFHTLVIHPELAFRPDQEGRGFEDYFVTVGEFRSMLAQLDANGWTLVDIHRVVDGQVRVPPGRKPFVLSEDDVNYYDYERPRGLGWRLVLDGDGRVEVEVHDATGVRVTDDDIVPIVDRFVEEHPEFSADGAKGIVAVTGYQGVFGERVQNTGAADHDAAVAGASAVAARLKATGWTIASHSYGHIDLSKDGLGAAQRDTARWKSVVGPIVGSTDVYIYPFGARPRPATLQMLRDNGFSIFCDIDITPKLVKQDGLVVMSRRHIDGIALRQQARQLQPFFDAATVEDRAARGRRP